MTGRNLTYIVNEDMVPFAWNHNWINETARYLNTEAVEHPHGCTGAGADFDNCMDMYRTNFELADILFVSVHPVVGNLLAHAEAPNVYDKLPDAAILANSEWVGRLHEMAFDFERMQSFYVVLDGEYFGGSESYVLKFRSAFMDVFQRIHVVLVESGLRNLWKKRSRKNRMS
ncbi:conserved hypothetical protein [Culex quinquefasciatus]|uniref:Uncharacterized protein n=1 Tax=Culex quinquefasciatus TaxID=7176 RepID=B0WBT2_CULQU|nr:conserved hypothetical protein [Culex quinquefasciatus]|eukprot:XP_001846166.1 conserved hypothetical protein [Culex quinquefasciatus]